MKFAYPVDFEIGDHDEEIHGIAVGSTLGHEHVLGPAAAAEIVLVH